MPPGSLLVDRDRFDALLVDRAVELGVTVLTPATATAPPATRIRLGDRARRRPAAGAVAVRGRRQRAPVEPSSFAAGSVARGHRPLERRTRPARPSSRSTTAGCGRHRAAVARRRNLVRGDRVRGSLARGARSEPIRSRATCISSRVPASSASSGSADGRCHRQRRDECAWRARSAGPTGSPSVTPRWRSIHSRRRVSSGQSSRR